MITCVIVFVQFVLRLLTDFVGLIALSTRPRASIEAENLFLRRELALCKERGMKPRRVDAATRVPLALLSRLFDWRGALVVVRPQTLIRWHRAGWRLFWRCKSRLGRPHMALGPGVPDPPLVVVRSSAQLARHQLGGRLVQRVKSILGGLHHEYSPAPQLA